MTVRSRDTSPVASMPGLPSRDNGRMNRRRFALFLALAGSWPALVLARPPNAFSKRALDPFVVYYGEFADPAIADYALAVLDGTVDGRALQHPDTTFLGYVSVGEVASYQPQYDEVRKEGILGEVNPNWPDSRFVDMRSELWHRRVLDELVPDLLAKGFDGVFLDTLDNAEHLEAVDPLGFRGMVRGAARLVDEMRRRYADVPIMINRGYKVLPLIAGRFDMLLGESVRSRFSESGHVMQSTEDYEWQRNEMWAALDRDPKLRLFSLDYWDPDDRETVAFLYKAQRSNGFIPYVSTKSLQQIFAAP